MLRRELLKWVSLLPFVPRSEPTHTKPTTWAELRNQTRTFVKAYLNETPCSLTDPEIDECFEEAAYKINERFWYKPLSLGGNNNWTHPPPGFLTTGLLPPDNIMKNMMLSYVHLKMMAKRPADSRIHHITGLAFQIQAYNDIKTFLHGGEEITYDRQHWQKLGMEYIGDFDSAR